MKKLVFLILLLAGRYSTAQNIDSSEYFIDIDPGFGAGNPIFGFTPGNNVSISFNISTAGLSIGMHNLFCRSMDASGKWSLTNHSFFYVYDSAGTAGTIDSIETFWDIDSGFGSGSLHPPSTLWADSSNYSYLAAVPSWLSLGFHKLFIRSYESRGRWSLTNLVDDSILVLLNGVNELSEILNINVFPNPFSESLSIQSKSNSKIRFIMYNGQGQLVFDKILEGETTISMKELSSGIYTAFFWKDRYKIYKTQLIKQ